METIFLDLNYSGECSQQQLDAYRNIGSVRHLRRLRQQEIRRKKRIKRILWALKNLFFGACFAFDFWIFASWINIVMHNTKPDPVYYAWNFFTLFF
jgi:hypothetical protein